MAKKAKKAKSTAPWKSPTEGFPYRDPDQLLWLGAEFAHTPRASRLKIAPLMRTLFELFGGDTVKISTKGNSGPLFRTSLDWRTQP